MRSIGPVGAMLSGGLDSSSIVALLHKDFAESLHGDLRTFTLAREPRESCAEWRAAQALLGGANIRSTVVTPSAIDVQWKTLLRGAIEADQPYGLLPGITNTLVYGAAKRDGCTVVFDGFAGDTLFWSADRSLTWALSRGRVRDAIAVLVGAYRYQGIGAIREASMEIVRHLTPSVLLEARRKLRRDRRFGSSGTLSAIERDLAHAYESDRERTRRNERDADRTGVNQHGALFVSGALSFAHEVYGGAAQSAGVDPRSPFSDRRVIEFAVQMPEVAKAALWRYKNTLRTALAAYLPEEIRNRDGNEGHPGSFYWERLGRCVANHESATPHPYATSGSGERWLNREVHAAAQLDVLRGTASEELAYRWLATEVLRRWRDAREDAA